MHGSFEVARFLGLSDNKIPRDDDDLESEILAHCWQVPDTSLTHFLMPECKDFSPHWIKGPCFTDDGGLRGGHHCGKPTQVSDKAAEAIMGLIKS